MFMYSLHILTAQSSEFLTCTRGGHIIVEEPHICTLCYVISCHRLDLFKHLDVVCNAGMQSTLMVRFSTIEHDIMFISCV
jgi:hypothetical protein